MGFMPEAMLNYLGRMGWSMPDEREKFSLAEMVEHFDLSRISLGGPIFDIEKLSWLNGQWLRELPVEEFAARVQQWAFNSDSVSYTHLTLPTIAAECRSRWSPYH